MIGEAIGTGAILFTIGLFLIGLLCLWFISAVAGKGE